MNRGDREWVKTQIPNYTAPTPPKPKLFAIPLPPPTPVWKTSNGDFEARRALALSALATTPVRNVTDAEMALLIKAGSLNSK